MENPGVQFHLVNPVDCEAGMTNSLQGTRFSAETDPATSEITVSLLSEREVLTYLNLTYRDNGAIFVLSRIGESYPIGQVDLARKASLGFSE